MKKFDNSGIISCHSMCDYDCIFSVIIVSRTDKSLVIKDNENGKTRRTKIYIGDEGEYIFPLGHYSMAPIMRAENNQKEVEPETETKTEMIKTEEETQNGKNKEILLENYKPTSIIKDSGEMDNSAEFFVYVELGNLNGIFIQLEYYLTAEQTKIPYEKLDWNSCLSIVYILDSEENIKTGILWKRD